MGLKHAPTPVGTPCARGGETSSPQPSPALPRERGYAQRSPVSELSDVQPIAPVD